MIRVLIADDHHLFREALERILADDPDIEVVGAVADGAGAIRMADELRPDLVLMDVNMPGVDGLEATRRLHNKYPELRVLMLTVSEKEKDLFDAVRGGARGYILKDASSEELLDAIHRVAGGEAMVSPGMAAKLLDAFAALSPISAATGGAEELTDREREVVRLIAKGLSNKEIAGQLDVTTHTVKTHVRRALEKLNLRTRTEAAVWAVRHEL